MKLKLFITTISVVFCTILVGEYFVTNAYAADLGYRWYTSYATIQSNASDYVQYPLNTRDDYHNNTDMTMYIDTDNADIEVVIVSGVSFGGRAIAHSAYGPCAYYSSGQLTGNCNTSDKKAAAGTVYIKSGAFPPEQRDWVIRHEIGHIFGMAHDGSGSCHSVMDEDYCVVSALQSFDISLMNSWY